MLTYSNKCDIFF